MAACNLVIVTVDREFSDVTALFLVVLRLHCGFFFRKKCVIWPRNSRHLQHASAALHPSKFVSSHRTVLLLLARRGVGT